MGASSGTYPLPVFVFFQDLCWGCEIEKVVKPASWVGIGGGCFCNCDFFHVEFQREVQFKEGGTVVQGRLVPFGV